MISLGLFASLLSLHLAAADPVSFQFSTQTSAAGEAFLTIAAEEGLTGLSVVITGSDGSKITRTVSVGAGGKVDIKWKQKSGSVHYTAMLEAGDFATDFEFDVQRPQVGGKHGKLKLISSAEELSVYHKAVFRSPFLVSKYTFTVHGIGGNQIDEQTKDGLHIAPGESMKFTWDSDDDVFMIGLRAEDEVGQYSEERVVPWRVDVPHTDVTFASGKWDIRDDQRKYLDETYAVLAHELDRLEQANRAVNGNITAQLYIVGYTDTVGDAASNQTLSLNRARAIAEYFHTQGVWCEIWYAGMGERGLAVSTGDGVDMEANRRATYIVGVTKPSGGKLPNSGEYRKLAEARPRPSMAAPELPESYYEYERARREENIRKRGGPAKGSSSKSSGAKMIDPKESSDGPVEFHHADDVDTSFEALAGGNEHEESAPPPVAGKPGATAKGCNTTGESQGLGLFAACAAMIFGRRRSRSRRR